MERKWQGLNFYSKVEASHWTKGKYRVHYSDSTWAQLTRDSVKGLWEVLSRNKSSVFFLTILMGMVRAILSSISVPEATSCISGSGIDSESPIKQEWQKKTHYFCCTYSTLGTVLSALCTLCYLRSIGNLNFKSPQLQPRHLTQLQCICSGQCGKSQWKDSQWTPVA